MVLIFICGYHHNIRREMNKICGDNGMLRNVIGMLCGIIGMLCGIIGMLCVTLIM
jgi:hypothetical protein